ncbi:Uncharacterized membrane protein [Pararobbsia alpina]|uniref:DUF1700 domain-containing protein n=1 Tax=Pararobbsia alpina TaxID=621374 RepID=UPI0039A587B0
MKQDAFIQKLRQELSSLPKAAVDEIVADYREYIGDAIAAGRDEEEVVAALGDPAKLARELKAQASYRQWESHRSFSNLARVIMSIAGLGLLNMLLLIPFMIYLSLLTAGYAMSIGLIIAGLVAVATLGSHRVFGWPATDALPFDMQILSNSHDASDEASDAKEAADDAKEAAQDAKEAANDAGDEARDAASEAAAEAKGDVAMLTAGTASKQASAGAAASASQPASSTMSAASSASSAPSTPSTPSASSASSASGSVDSKEPPVLANLKDMKIVGDSFQFNMVGSAHLALVTTAGSVTIHTNDNGGLRIIASNDAVQNQLTVTNGHTVSVKRKDIVTMSLHDDDSRVSMAHDPTHGGRLLWDVRSGDDHVSFIQNEHGEPTHVAIQNGTGSVVLNGHELKIDDGNDHLRFRVRPGASVASTGLAYGIASLLGGIVGLLLCVWLTRWTWRSLVRYAKRQVDVITMRLEGNEM